MLQIVPGFVSAIFIATTMFTLFLVLRAIRLSGDNRNKSKNTIVFVSLIIWLIIQAVISLNEVYSKGNNQLPPKLFLFGILPVLICIAVIFISPAGRRFIDGVSLEAITLLNVVRVPVEIVLWLLFIYNAIPAIMTFEGRNFDIIIGITAPIMAWLVFTKKKLSQKVLLIWNCLGLLLLLNIVVIAILSTVSPLQKFGFDQPNLAILYFPFTWLPTFIVPVVLLGHLISIRRLTKSVRKNS